MKHARRDNPGFTLLEVLIALVMMSVVIASLYSSVKIAYRARQSANAAMETASALRVTMNMLSAEFHAAKPPTGVLAAQFTMNGLLSVGGATDEIISFYISEEASDPKVGVGDVCRVALALVSDADNHSKTLVRRITRNLLAPIALLPVEETLCRRVALLEMRCFDGQTWTDTWDSTAQNNTLPIAVEITLELEPVNALESHGKRITRVFQIPCGEPNLEQTDPAGAVSF